MNSLLLLLSLFNLYFTIYIEFQYLTGKVNQSLTFHCGCGKDCLDTYVCFKLMGKIHYSNRNHSNLTQIYATHDESLRCKGQVRVHVNILFSLPPANEVCEGYVFTDVCLSTGEVSAPLHAGIHTPSGRRQPLRGRHPPGSRHPPEQTPPTAVHAGRYGQQASGMHLTGMHTGLSF